MPRIKPLLVLCAALLTVTPAASADVNSDMNQFFNKLGFASNTTQPGVWQGQAAGYAYGGSLYARTQVKNVQLISMTLPDINAGCGGIDAYLGSFSFINGEQLQRFVKQIMSNAAGYFFDLALQTTVPEIKTAKDFLQKMASDINSMNLSSCQAAQGITGRYQCNASDCSGTTGNGPGGVEQSRKCPAWFQQQYCQCLEHTQSVWL